MNDLKLAPDELIPHVAAVVIKAQASCPPARVQNKVCRFISPSDIATLEKSKKKEAIEAEEMLLSFRGIVKAQGLKPADQTRFLGQLDTVTVRFLLGKPMELTVKTLQEVAVHFMTQLQKITGHECAKISVSAASSSNAVPNLVEFDNSGKAVGAKRLTLKQRGFIEGTPVTDEEDNILVVRRIDIDGSVVVCRSSTVDIEEGTVVSFDDFLSKYNKTKSEVKDMNDWQKNTPSNTDAYQETLSKCRIQLAAAMLANKFGTPNVRIQLKPHKSVFVEDNVSSGKLVLVPETTRISAGSDIPVGGYRCKVKDTTGKQYALLPLFSNIFAVPAWCIRTSEDEEEANMDVQHKKVSVTAASESNNVEVPVLVNNCALKKGAELIVHRPAPEKKGTKRHMALSTEAPPH